jgi:hypothetical protein
MASSVKNTMVTFLINNKYPNGVEFAMLEDFNFGNIIIRCKECKKLGLTWEKYQTPEMFATAQSTSDMIVNVRQQLVEHAKCHNELVKVLAEKLDALVEKYGLDNKVTPGALASPPNIKGSWFKDEELMKEFDKMIGGYSTIIDPSMGHFQKPTKGRTGIQKKKEIIKEESEHRRISLDEEE